MLRLLGVVALFGCLNITPAGASQLYFHRNLVPQTAQQAEFEFAYQWRDLDHQPRQLRFQVPFRNFTRTPVEFRPLSQARLNREVRAPLLEYARDQGWHDVELSLRHNDESMEIVMQQGNDASRAERAHHLRQTYRQLQYDLLHANYYHTFTDHTRREGYKPDHMRIANESVQALRPVAESFATLLGDDSSPRETLRLLLSFLQSIPYADLTNRFTSPGAGYHPPTRVLFENRGDCDSKVTLLAALYNLLHPEIETLIIYLPGHAIFAANIEPEANDYWVWHEDMQYVVADPTGPARLEPGQVTPRYQIHVYNGAFVSEPF